MLIEVLKKNYNTTKCMATKSLNRMITYNTHSQDKYGYQRSK